MNSPKWHPTEHGLSYSGLNLWLQDKTAFEVQYLMALEAPEPWRKELACGSLFQAGIEGYIKTRTKSGAARFLETELKAQSQDQPTELMLHWAKIMLHIVYIFIDLYDEDKDLPLSSVEDSEVAYQAEVELPSGRSLILKGGMDGIGPSLFMENKCRGQWDEYSISREISRNLQYNIYVLLYLAQHGELPEKVWYQHVRRPGGFGYKGPRKKKAQTDDEYINELVANINKTKDYHFYRYIERPGEEFYAFCHSTLYPMLEAFLDWYEWITSDQTTPNRVHWMTPYGLYNPLTEGRQEKYRDFRLTGSTQGLVPRKLSRAT